MATTLIHLDDEIQILDLYAAAFTQSSEASDFHIKSFDSVNVFQKQLTALKSVDIFIIDLHLGSRPDDGLSIVSRCRMLFPGSLIFVSSNARDHNLIHSSLQLGADDFLPKNLDTNDMVRLVENKFKIHSLRRGIENSQRPIAGAFMNNTSKRIPHIIDSAINCVHLFGETGTGKEIIADTFESNLPPNTPFVRINCGAISTSLVVSEMFGHAKGAFTGAICDKKGLIEAANNGWIFLDEIATLPSDAQSALLRAIDNQKIRRIGSTKDFTVNFRVLSATNESLEDLVAAGKFRKDLWQRLREAEIVLPPLRDRKKEVPELIRHFCNNMRGGPYTLAPTVLEILNNYDWREGNIRELRNCLRSMTEKAANKLLTPTCIPERIWHSAIEKSTNQALLDQTKNNDPMSRLELTWQDSSRPKFDKLCSILLIELIRSQYASQGKVSMRSLARTLGIPKSSLPLKIKTMLDFGLAKKSEIHDLIGIG